MIDYEYDTKCELCDEIATIQAIDENKENEKHYFCFYHYGNWVNNEIELPQSRLDILNYI